MDRIEFMNALDQALSPLDEGERKHIIMDYEQHFRRGYESGLEDAAIIANMATPEQIASAFLNNQTFESAPFESQPMEAKATESGTAYPAVIHNQSSKKKNANQKKGLTVEQVLIGGLLIFINLVFVLGPYIALWGVWFSLAMVGVAFLLVGVRLIIGFALVSTVSVIFSEITMIAVTAFFLCFGGMIIGVMVKAAQGFGVLTHKYVSWLVKLVRGV